jgi:hypothetical protein
VWQDAHRTVDTGQRVASESVREEELRMLCRSRLSDTLLDQYLVAVSPTIDKATESVSVQRYRSEGEWACIM